MNVLESRLYRILEVAANFFLLNLLWLLACVPVFTVYPSTAALFGVVREWAKGREDGIFRTFYAAFKENFWQSLQVGLTWTLVGGFLALDLVFVLRMDSVARPLLFVPLLLLGLLYVFASVYLFPVMVGYETSWTNVLKNSLLFSIIQPLTTIGCLIVLGVAAAAFLYLPFTLLATGSATAYLIYRLCDRSFMKVQRLKKEGGADRDAR